MKKSNPMMHNQITNLGTTRRVTCEVCHKHSAHILIEHLQEAHKMSASQYVEKYPDAPLWSNLGQKHLAARFDGDEIAVDRKTEKLPLKKVFAPWIKSSEEVERFVDAGPETPEVDEDYVLPEEQTVRLIMTLDFKERNRAYIQGPSGTGKTQLVFRVAAGLNYELARINGDTAITRAELVGEWVVRGSEMVFIEGIIPRAMRRGQMLLIDEIDCFDPHTLNTLRSVLEDRPSLNLLEKGGEVIRAGRGLNPNFRVVATANTWGTGDTTGLYGTTSVMSAADRQRFSAFLKLDYLDPKLEREMLKQRFKTLETSEADAFVRVANEIRAKHKEGKLDEGFSPRQLVNWAEKFLVLGDPLEAARLCFLNSYVPEMQVAVDEIIRHVIPQT